MRHAFPARDQKFVSTGRKDECDEREQQPACKNFSEGGPEITPGQDERHKPARSGHRCRPDMARCLTGDDIGNRIGITGARKRVVVKTFGHDDRAINFGPVTGSCRPRCSFKPPFIRRRQDFSSPVPSDVRCTADDACIAEWGVDYRSR